MNRIERVVIMQNHLGELGGVTTFCQGIAPALADLELDVEVGAVTPAPSENCLRYEPRVTTWNLIDTPNPQPPSRQNGRKSETELREYQRVTDERTATMLRNAERRFAAYGPETLVIFTQLYARERASVAALSRHWPRSFHTVGQYHSSFVAARDSNDLRRIKRVFTEVDKFLALTEEDAGWFRRSGLNNTGFIHNPISVPSELQHPQSSRKAVAISRYDPKKGLDHLLRAWAELGEATAQWTLELYGDGPDRERLEHLIESYGIEANVFLMGFTEDVEGVLRGASINILPSRIEGLPFSLMEASALGVPSVAYDCSPGISAIIEDRATGIVVPVNDEIGLRGAIQELISSDTLREHYSLEGHRRMKEMFSVEVVANKWLQLIEELQR